MIKKHKLKKLMAWILVFSVSTIMIEGIRKESNYVFAANIYSWGSTGDTVRTIQEKLKRWHYMDGPVDGIYGYKTWEAVKLFQKKNGIKVDGVVGRETLNALGINQSSSSSDSSSSSHESDVWLMACAINGEGRGEPYVGQVAIGAVIMNRVNHPSFPNTIAGVIYQPGAFDAVKDGQINLTPSSSCIKAARDAINGWDPTNGAIYYWNPSTATNKWIQSVPVMSSIGNHVFGKK